MTELKIGSLFSGYGGLDIAVESVTGARTAWVSDIDKGACKILAHRYPDIPNHGDLTAIDWAAIEPVDIITGGFPCQDLSHAGKRAGMTDTSRSGLWSYMCEAINIIRPRLVVAENVRGLLSAEALRPVEPCTWCVGDEPVFDVRALGAVLADLADIGYDAQWFGLPAGSSKPEVFSVGACHGRFRIFLSAHPFGSGWEWVGQTQLPGPPGDIAGNSSSTSLLPTPRTSDTNGAGVHGEGGVDLRTAVTLLPTPRAGDGEKGGGPNQRGSSGDLMLPSAVIHMLPTPRASRGASTTETFDLLPTPAVNDMGAGKTVDHTIRLEPHRPNDTDTLARALVDFGQYDTAVARWGAVMGRPAPPPTEPTGKNGAHRLSPRFVEWMMGLPDGWIADVPGITRNEVLKAGGNGVVWQQAAAALRILLDVSAVAA